MPPKRKRGGADQGPGRPSPHRPGDSSLAQRSNSYESNRGGRGSRNTRQGGRHESANYDISSVAPAVTPTASRPPSRAAPPPTPQIAQPATRVEQPEPVEPAAPPPPRSFEVVTDDRVVRWKESGAKEVADEGTQFRTNEDYVALSSIYLELLHSSQDGRLDPQSAGTAVKVIAGPALEASSDFDAHTIFCDTLSVALDADSSLLRPPIRAFLEATDISPDLMRMVLEQPVLESLGLVQSTYKRLYARYITNLHYRQANFNLLREESEGYSKLKTELFTTCSTEPPKADAVKATFEKVKALIGTFDLDVGRVLDVTLDVFAAVLVKQFRFFIKFLRVSSWWPVQQIQLANRGYTGGLPKWALPDHKHWLTDEEEDAASAEARQQRDVDFWQRARAIHLDAFFELGGRRLVPTDQRRLDDALAKVEGDDLSALSAELRWMKDTNTLPPSGHKIAAQLLGFKLRFYCSDARDKDDILPANLLYLAALLIKVGFISLTDLWEHLYPDDEKMIELKDKKLKEIEEKERESRPGGASNALLMAGALPDDMPAAPVARRDAAAAKPEAAKKEEDKAAEEAPKLPEPVEQKVALLKDLLTIGCIPESLFILGRYDWLPQAYPELLPLIHRIIHHSIDRVFQDSTPMRLDAHTSEASTFRPLPEPDQSGVPKGSVKLGQVQPKRPLRWPFPDNPNSDGSSYRFYWDEWADNVPVCQTVDDVFTLCSTFLNLSGVNIGIDADLMTKLGMIGIKSLADDLSPENRARWQDLARRLLVPALSLTGSNSSVVELVWRLIRDFPTKVRYNIYAEWFEGQISRLEPMKKAFSRTRLETLGTMKRLSLDNIPQMARTLAKTAFASPGIVFKVALDQIEAYSNLVKAVVECAKYFTDLGYDVLVWSLMSSLGGKQRSRTQTDSVLLTSKWLQALSKFSGQVFKRYSVMNSTPVLQYVNDQLVRGNSTDLVILKELITSMGGVVSDIDFTDAQMRAMTGGDALRRETLISLQDKRFDSSKSAHRLMTALMQNKLAGGLLINIAQYRQTAIFKVPDEEAHTKFLATMVDDTQQVLVQYLELLRANLKPEQFDELVPDVVSLMRDFGLEVGLAFMISRASLAYKLAQAKITRSSPTKQLPTPVSTSADTEGDVVMDLTKADSPVASAEEEDKMAVDEKETAEPTPEQDIPPKKAADYDPILETLQPVVDAMPELVHKDVWQQLSPVFYTVFWTLQLGDVSVPERSYMEEHQSLKKQSEAAMRDRTDMTRAGVNKLNQKKKDLSDRMTIINKELSDHVNRYQKTRYRLARQSKTWFPSPFDKASQTADIIMEQCLIPRVVLSAADAEYCFKMVKFLHENRTPNFKLMALYDRFFHQNRLRVMLFSCTVREAEYLGRFVRSVLGDLQRWHADRAVYEKEALGQTKPGPANVGTRNNPGFATAFDEEGKPTKFLEHDEFRVQLFVWHRNLHSALKSSLGGMEWMHIRNAITILKTGVEFFPAITFMGNQLVEQLKVITEREAASKSGSDGGEEGAGHRVDLSVAAQTAYSGLLKRRKEWVIVQLFRPMATDGKEAEKDAKKATPTGPAAGATGLRATAAEFQPKGAAA
jgi:THO complex subunit 2